MCEQIKLNAKYQLLPKWFEQKHGIPHIPELQIGGSTFEVIELSFCGDGEPGAAMVRFESTGNVYHIDQYPRYWCFFNSYDLKHDRIKSI
jgi:hypothetical protein